MTDLLSYLLTADACPVACETVDAWWPRLLSSAAPFEGTLDRAVAGGFAADRLGWAFAAGYHHALRALVPSLPPGDPAALAATEEGGGHPRAMATTLRPTAEGEWRLSGTKRFVTLGRRARSLLVVASVGSDASGRNALRLVRLSADAPGISLDPLPETPFAPEIEHAQAVFSEVRVTGSELLPGDGYDRYLKPFRTLEDLHVIGAGLGHLLAAARRRAWPEALREELLATIAALRALSAEPPSGAATHVALAGAFRSVARIIAEADERYAAEADDEAARWVRDRALLRVAERVREQRRAAAWRALGGVS
ncbi:MAG: acyl-CoA dehydrogenase family protein [Myxococcaceae bacterium]|nr:MAG: acyl-CoA dehydrogenase family protein [Myxococcaceae bacterium]